MHGHRGFHVVQPQGADCAAQVDQGGPEHDAEEFWREIPEADQVRVPAGLLLRLGEG